MAIVVNDILELIRVCQDFDNKFTGNETVDLFAGILGISKISYRIFFNDVSIESSVIFDAPNSTLGEEFDFQRIASNDRLIVLKIFRFADANPLSSEDSYNLQVFGEIVMSGICVKNLLKAYEKARYYDSLTQLTNVNFFMNILDKLLESGKNDIYSVACVNIKNCGAINRIFGSDITDRIIRDFAQDSLDLFDQNEFEVISRLSSDNFVLISLTSHIDEILNKMNNLEVSVEINGDIVEYNVRIRAGVVNLANNIRKSSDIIHLAENALGYSRLEEHPDIYYINGDGNPNGNKSFIYISEISQALKSQQFLIYFNPVFKMIGNNTSKMTLVAAKAELRWRKDGRLVDPYTLITTNADKNILRDMDDFLFRKTCEIMNNWKSEGISFVPITIHIRSFDYFNSAFADNIIRSVDRYKIPREQIVLEFGEDCFRCHNDEMMVSTQKFTKYGLRICVADYGSNNSSLSLLSTYDYQYLKLNSDIMNSDSAKEKIVVENLISMASKLGFEVICSDPKDEETVRNAASYGCNYYVGELFEKVLSERFFKKRMNNPELNRISG